MTAIAAVLALSSTQLVAQTVEPAPAAVSTTPVMVTPPPVASAPATVSAVPSAVNIAPSVAKTPAPVSVDLGPDTAAPDPAARSGAAPTPAPRAASTPRVAVAVPRSVPESTPVAPTRQQVVAPVTPAPLPTSSVETSASPAPIAVKTTTAKTTDTGNDMLPIAGGAAAALLLAGGAFALSRRRRPDAAEAYSSETLVAPVEPVVPAAMPMAAAATPMAYRAPIVAPRSAEGASSNAPVTQIPVGFDLSRFGRHTQAAYRGPTPENPSLSLKRRLSRASFFDQRERMAAERPGDIPTAAYPSTASTASVGTSRHAEYVTTKVKTPPRPNFRPAYQS